MGSISGSSLGANMELARQLVAKRMEEVQVTMAEFRVAVITMARAKALLKFQVLGYTVGERPSSVSMRVLCWIHFEVEWRDRELPPKT
jgi:hypothetical protein